MFAALYLSSGYGGTYRIISSRVPTCWGRNTCRRALRRSGDPT